MRIIITGGTGLIGMPLVKLLARDGHEVIVLSRNPNAKTAPAGAHMLRWDARTPESWGYLVDGDTAIVNLAGENPASWLWTDAHKQRIRDSRLAASAAVAEAIMAAPQTPRALLQASAVGYYGDTGDDIAIEQSPPGDDWRARLCVEWEDATAGLPVRRCLLRIGIVLDRSGGAFPPMLLGARLLGRQIGNGRQWVPWVHNHDVARAIRFLLRSERADGAFNLVAPQPQTNAAFMRYIGEGTGTPSLFTMPERVLRAAVGEMADTVLASQRVLPQRLSELGYSFLFPTAEDALRHLLHCE
jgi:uncharacterized protein (TIGR01777 family)